MIVSFCSTFFTREQRIAGPLPIVYRNNQNVLVLLRPKSCLPGRAAAHRNDGLSLVSGGCRCVPIRPLLLRESASFRRLRGEGIPVIYVDTIFASSGHFTNMSSVRTFLFIMAGIMISVTFSQPKNRCPISSTLVKSNFPMSIFFKLLQL